jgi:ribosomal protein S18 acetylase RimI-like enzyme
MNKLKIRQFRKKDSDALIGILDDIFNKEDSRSAKKDIIFETELKKDHIRDDWTYWVAEVDKKMIGFVGIIVYSKSKSSWISWLGVRNKFQGKGVEKKLLEHAIKETKKTKAKNLLVEGGTLPMFKRANNLYQKYGFKDKFKIKDYWCKGDHLIVMSKKL